MRAPTGTGKTIAYLAPIVQKLAEQSPRVSRGEGCHAIIITPTRELTLQVRAITALRYRFVCTAVSIRSELH